MKPSFGRPFLPFLAGLVLFGLLATWMETGGSAAFDDACLHALRSAPATPAGPSWVESMAVQITALGSPALLALAALGAVSLLAIARHGRAALFVAAASIGGALLDRLLKVSFERARPATAYRLVSASGYSFPSGHAMATSVVYVAIALAAAHCTPRKGLRLATVGFALLLAFLVGSSRVYLGVHYATDVLAGWSAALAWLALLRLWWTRRSGGPGNS